jgi:hypothetical protein
MSRAGLFLMVASGATSPGHLVAGFIAVSAESFATAGGVFGRD